MITDLNAAIENGIKIDDTEYSVTIRSFICDTPARNHIKGNI